MKIVYILHFYGTSRYPVLKYISYWNHFSWTFANTVVLYIWRYDESGRWNERTNDGTKHIMSSLLNGHWNSNERFLSISQIPERCSPPRIPYDCAAFYICPKARTTSDAPIAGCQTRDNAPQSKEWERLKWYVNVYTFICNCATWNIWSKYVTAKMAHRLGMARRALNLPQANKFVYVHKHLYRMSPSRVPAPFNYHPHLPTALTRPPPPPSTFLCSQTEMFICDLVRLTAWESAYNTYSYSYQSFLQSMPCMMHGSTGRFISCLGVGWCTMDGPQCGTFCHTLHRGTSKLSAPAFHGSLMLAIAPHPRYSYNTITIQPASQHSGPQTEIPPQERTWLRQTETMCIMQLRHATERMTCQRMCKGNNAEKSHHCYFVM